MVERTRTASAVLEPALLARLEEVCDAARDRWERFDREVRQKRFHPFVAADYHLVVDSLVGLAKPGLRFLEWGSATGFVTILADLLGFEAFGIELDESLVREARDNARIRTSGARFAAGSLMPTGYRWDRRLGDGRLGTLGQGSSGYLGLGIPLEEFDVVYAYPWSGEEPIMLDVMRQYGRADALLLLHSGSGGITTYRGGAVLP